MPTEKAGWELHSDAVGCFEQILEEVLIKTATVGPLTSHLTHHPHNMNKTSWELQEKKKQTHKQCSSMDSNTWVPQY